MTASLADFEDHFAANPDGFLLGKARVSTRTHGGNVTQRGEMDIFLFSMERLENRLDMQKYINVLGYVDGRVVNNLFEHEGTITANVWMDDDDYPAKSYHLQTDTFVPAVPSPDDLVNILRWKQRVFKEQGIVDPTQVFEAGQNKVALEFFTALFSGPISPEVEHLKKGIEILSKRVQELEASGEAPLKVGDPVEFTDGRRAKIVELFPSDDKVAVLTPHGKIYVAPYGDVTKLK